MSSVDPGARRFGRLARLTARLPGRPGISWTEVGQALVVAWPMLFALAAWIYSAGLPYFYDANETFLSYEQGRTMYLFDPRQYAFLTPADDTVQGEPPTHVYGHNPNLGRYVHLLLFSLGIQSLPIHVFIITIPCSLITMLMLFKLFREALPGSTRIWLIVPIAFGADFTGFLAHTATTFRTFAFVFFWGCLSVVLFRAPFVLVAIAFFALFQFEYAFALFVSVTALTLLALSARRDGWRRAAAMALGSGASVLVFLGQHLAYQGVQGLVEDLGGGYASRGAGQTGHDLSTLASLAATSVDYLVRIYNPVLDVMLAWAIASSVLVLLVAPRIGRLVARRALRTSEPAGVRGPMPVLAARLFVGRLLVATSLGMLAVAVLLPGYFVAAYLASRLPLLVFPVTLATAVVALDLVLMLQLMLTPASRRTEVALVLLACTASLTPLVITSVQALQAYPALGPTYVRLLQSAEFAGQPFVAPANYHNLAAALTHGLAAPSPMAVSRTDLERYSRLRNTDGRLFYLCIERRWNPSVDCHAAARAMRGDGHRLLYEDSDFVILELRSRRDGSGR